MSPDRVLVIGGPGTISTSLIASLVERGAEVAVLTRPKAVEPSVPGATMVYGDRNDEAVLDGALAQSRPTYVVDTVCFTEAQASDVVRALRGRVEQLVFLSTIDAYGYPLSRLPVSEDDPLCEPNSPYAAAKRVCEELFAAAQADGDLSTTVIRVGYSLSPKFLIGLFGRDGGATLVARARTGRPVVVPGDGMTLLQVGTGFDTGRMIASLVGRPTATGRVVNCGGRAILTHDDYVRLIATAAGADVEIVHIPSDVLLASGEPSIRDGILPVLTRFNIAQSLDRFFELVPDFQFGQDLGDGIRAFVERQESAGALPSVDAESPEDRILSAWATARESFAARLARG